MLWFWKNRGMVPGKVQKGGKSGFGAVLGVHKRPAGDV